MVLVRICIRSVWSSGGRAGAAEYGRSSGTGSLRPGLIAAVTVKGLGAKTGDLQYNNAVPILISTYLPNGMLGIAITGLLAAFMAGVAANVTAFNTVVSYDLWGAYVRNDEPDEYYVRFGRIVTVVGIVIAIGTASSRPGSTASWTTSRRCSRSSTRPCSPPSSSPCSGGGPPPGPGSGGWPPAPWPRSPSTSCTPAAPWTSARRCRPTSGGPAMPSLFDLRMVIGGLLVLYGVALTVLGLVAADDARAKAAGININLWAGLAILASGAVFLAWALLRPLRAEDVEGDEQEES